MAGRQTSRPLISPAAAGRFTRAPLGILVLEARFPRIPGDIGKRR